MLHARGCVGLFHEQPHGERGACGKKLNEQKCAEVPGQGSGDGQQSGLGHEEPNQLEGPHAECAQDCDFVPALLHVVAVKENE